MRRDIEVDIDTLVVEGLSQADGVRAGDAFSRELVRLFEGASASPVLRNGRAIDRLDAGAATSRIGQPGALGTAVARAVHRGLVP